MGVCVCCQEESPFSYLYFLVTFLSAGMYFFGGLDCLFFLGRHPWLDRIVPVNLQNLGDYSVF